MTTTIQLPYPDRVFFVFDYLINRFSTTDAKNRKKKIASLILRLTDKLIRVFRETSRKLTVIHAIVTLIRKKNRLLSTSPPVEREPAC